MELRSRVVSASSVPTFGQTPRSDQMEIATADHRPPILLQHSAEAIRHKIIGRTYAEQTEMNNVEPPCLQTSVTSTPCCTCLYHASAGGMWNRKFKHPSGVIDASTFAITSM